VKIAEIEVIPIRAPRKEPVRSGTGSTPYLRAAFEMALLDFIGRHCRLSVCLVPGESTDDEPWIGPPARRSAAAHLPYPLDSAPDWRKVFSISTVW
jgi:hypothetical protein